MSSADLSKPSKMSGGTMFDDDEPIKKPSKSAGVLFMMCTYSIGY